MNSFYMTQFLHLSREASFVDSAHLHISLMQKGFERKEPPKAAVSALNFSALRQGGEKARH